MELSPCTECWFKDYLGYHHMSCCIMVTGNGIRFIMLKILLIMIIIDKNGGFAIILLL